MGYRTEDIKYSEVQRILISQQLRSAVWNSLHDALTNQKYWSARARKIQKFDQWINVVVISFSLSTFASFLTNIDFLLKISSVILSVISVAITIVNWADKAGLCSELARSWREIFHEFDKIWLVIGITDFETALDEEISSIRSNFAEVQKRPVPLIGKDVKISDDKRLKEEIKQEVNADLEYRYKKSEVLYYA